MKRLLLFTALVALLYVPRIEAAATGCSFPATLDTFTDVVAGQLLTAGAYNKIQCAVEKLESRPAIPRVLANARPSSPASGEVIVITNAASSTDCGTTGGGTNKVTCQYNGSAWEVIGGGGGGGSPSGSTTEVQFRLAGAFSGDSAFTYDNVNQILKVLKLELGNVATNSLSLDTSAITGAKTWTALNLGGNIALSTGARTDGDFLKYDSSGLIVSGGKLVRVRAYNTGNLTIPNTTWTALTFDSERWDTHSLHSTSTNTGRITFDAARSCIVVGSAIFAANATGSRSLYVRLNGTTYLSPNSVLNSGASFNSAMAVPVIYDFSQNDYIELVAYQDSGGNLNVNSDANYSPELAVQCL